MFKVAQITVLPQDLNVLMHKARKEGFRFLDRLNDEFKSRVNRFLAAGEALYEVRHNESLVGVGGLNVDPYVERGDVGRLRRFYVDPDFRNRGVGRLLLNTIEQHGRKRFCRIDLYTDSHEAAMFYSRVGYEKVKNQAHVSHIKVL